MGMLILFLILILGWGAFLTALLSARRMHLHLGYWPLIGFATGWFATVLFVAQWTSLI